MLLPTEIAWICPVCGYIHYGSEPPDICPVCGVGREMFEEYIDPSTGSGEADEKPAVWRCKECGFIHYGSEPPEFCPVCGQPASMFEPVKSGKTKSFGSSFGSKTVIVGAGIAGVSAAESIRKSNPDEQIILVSKEVHLPYYRLNLTRYLAGELTREELILHPAEWYSDNNITLMRGVEATSIDLPRKYIILSNGDVVTFDTLILATGSEPVMPPFPGVDQANVTALRTVDNADRLIMACGQGKKFVCIGGGILGLEAAGALAARGEDVTVVEVMPWLMPRQLNRSSAELFKENILSIGIKLFAGVKVKAITGNGSVDGVMLDNGTHLPADVVIISAGVKVDTEIIKEAGIKTNNGIVVDAAMKTDYSFVFAAGDAAEINGAMYGTWGPSQGQGTIAGMNASGRKTDFSPVPRSNTLKVLGINLFSIGPVNPMPEGAFMVEEISTGLYTGLVFTGEVLIGGVLLGDTTLSPVIKKAVEKKRNIPQKTIQAGLAAIIDFLRS